MKNALNLRERLILSGAKTLSDVELIAILISSGNQNQSSIALAQTLFDHFGSLRALLNTNLHTFCQIKGLGPVRFAQLQAAKEIIHRNEMTQLQKLPQLTSSDQTFALLKKLLRDEKNEVFIALFLDNQHRVIAYEPLFRGSINSTTIYLRPIIERIIAHNAAAIILAHNHPSGVSDASAEDFAITDKIKKAIGILDTRLLDHIVIGDNEAFSIFNEQKWLC
ncbi:DNA repair protein RadC [Legionella sp. W05-934-2]|jgi:DNA repair protein RadC|uniref:RadC family protein n=1 Tax=Legionella sp. W05-934-2 TaxID=1198649 RepID=UPI003461CFFB